MSDAAIAAPEGRAADSPAIGRGRRAAAALLGITSGLAVAYLAMVAFAPTEVGVGWTLVYAVMELLSGVTVLLISVTATLDARSRRAWALLGVALILLAASAAAGTRESDVAKYIADGGWLASFPFFFFGLLTFPSRPLSRREQLRTVLDGAVLVASTGLLIWYLGTLGIRVQGPDQFTTFDAFNATVLVGDALMIYAVGVVAVRTPERLHRASWVLLLLTFALSTMGDIANVARVTSPQASTSPVGLSNLLWTLAAWLVAVAAFYETRSGLATRRAARPVQLLDGLPSVVPYVAAGLLAIVAGYEAFRLPDAVFRVLAVGSVLVGGLVAARLVLALRDNAVLLAEQSRQAEERRESQKLEAIGRLAGGVAHEFNNLLIVIQQGIDAIAERGGDDPDARDVRTAAERATELTRQLLTFSRRDEATIGISDAAADLTELRPLLQRLMKPDVQLRIESERWLPMIALDRGRFDQVIFNLVRNAVDAIAGAGEIVIRAEPSPMSGFVRVSVTDTGSGMSGDVRARLFEPFFTTKPVGQGTGLGLAIVHGIVTSAGGVIEVESTRGQGTRFVFDLPEASPDESLQREAPAAADAVPERLGHTVLLVDDEPSVRRSLRRTLERLGHGVREAEDGVMALDALARETDITLILTDTKMPNMDGWELIKTVRAQRPELPIIRMSGFAEPPESLPRDLSDAFLPKPFDLTRLKETVLKVTAERRQAS